jgi:hypothetical protein
MPDPVIGTVRNELTDGAGRALQNVTVKISLIAPRNPFLLNGLGEVLQAVAVDTGTSGVWVASLLANAEFEQADTYYVVDETCAPGGQKWAIRMPDGGDYELRDLLVHIPPGDSGTGPTVPGGVFQFEQSFASAEWVIPHGLGYPPVIQCLEGVGAREDPADGLWWRYRLDPDLNSTVLQFGAPVSGRAYCS